VDDEFVRLENGLQLHFERWGLGEPNMVLVHGLGSSCHIWDLTAPRLASEFGVVALDQRGHGESDQPDDGYDFASIVSDLAGFVDHLLSPGRQAVFVGHSWGASVVLNFGVTHPERTAGLVLVDGGTGSPGERWTWEETETRLRPPDLDSMSWSDLRASMAGRNGTFSDPRVEAISRSMFHIDSEHRVRRRFRIPNHMQIVRALWEQRPIELVRQVRSPLLVLPARQDTDAADFREAKQRSVDRVVQVQPTARVRWFENTIHDVPLQRPDELAAELLAFGRQVLQHLVHGPANSE